MNAVSFPSLGLSLALLLPTLPAQAQAPAAASSVQLNQLNVIVTDDGGLDAQTVRTLRSLTISELRKQGSAINDDPALEGVHPAGEATQTLLKRLGGRTFALRVSRLGTKLPLTLEEVKADGTVINASSLTAGTIEESDIVITRLVESLMSHKQVEDTARIATVTTEEARPFQKRPGDNHFVIGLLNPLFSGNNGSSDKNGISMGYLYEAEHFMFGIEGLYTKSGDANIGSTAFIHGAWLPLDGDISPYIGGGIGYLGGDDGEATMHYGIGYKLTAGVEFFRLRHLRVQVGVDLYFPTSRTETINSYQWDPVTGNGTTTSREVTARSSFPVMHVKVAF